MDLKATLCLCDREANRSNQTTEGGDMREFSATYSPEDNKLRLESVSRLDAETYTRVKAAGFRWAPQQKIFVAPMWTPEREDLLLELAGEIEDEDKSLVERAEERAERFEDYHEARTEDAERAHKAVAAIADNIPLGQPILVGHHSERHARRDAEKIENGMRRAVKMWETAQYWKQRAAGAIRNAKYKERPDVRARRIKGLESDIRVMKGKYTPDTRTRPQVWDGEENVYCGIGSRGGRWVKRSELPGLEAYYSRWISHCERRLEYERAMLEADGGPVSERFNIEVGGRVQIRGEWLLVLKVNKDREGRVCSVTTNARYVSIRGVEEIKDYRAPEGDDAAKVKAAVKLAPLCNYPGDGFATMTQVEWDDAHKDYKGSREIAATETTGRHRARTCIGLRCHLPPPQGKELEPNYCSANRRHGYWFVFVTDAKRKDPPPPEPPKLTEATPPEPDAATLAKWDSEDLAASERIRAQRAELDDNPDPEPTVNPFEAMRETLRAGVQVVSSPDLFPTPSDLARRMVELAEIPEGAEVLEPSAGTGRLLDALINRQGTAWFGADIKRLVAIEWNYTIAKALTTTYAVANVKQADFMECNGDLGKFDRILMNPPFSKGQDIKHIEHAVTFLKPGGRLVAICANGPRQQERLKPQADIWEDLPAGTFKESGTGVNTALLVINH